jgi:two-component system, OmpR family, sensor kinase
VQTIRGRLTAWYATALTITLAVFAALLYVARRGASFEDLDARVRSEADLSAGILMEINRTGGVLVRQDAAGRPILTQEIAATLEAVPGFLIITHQSGRVLFASADARALTFDEFEQLRHLLAAPPGGPQSGAFRVAPGGPTVRYVIRPLTDAGPQFGALLTGADPEAAELGPRQLLSTVLLVLPLVVLAAVLVGQWIAGRALEPLGQIITEVREISDGTSLHRRLAKPMVEDELGRLAETLNQMMGRLERSFSALRRFTADASHELKTPLTVMRAGLERALATPALPPDALPWLEESLQELNRMTELVDALLTLARVDEGRAPLHREPVDLRAIVEEARETGELLAEQAGVTIEIATPPDPLVLDVDRSRVRQLLLNLLTNAMKYTPRGGRVSVRLGQENGKITLAVADTGIGIAPGDVPHIFDRFYRADTARTRTGERPGAGLGLAICKWIAQAHGGTIDVQSRPGRGTVFTVSLPQT